MATKRKIRGGEVGSITKLKNKMKRGGPSAITFIPEDSSIVVRFLGEPDTWVEFFEHYDAVRKNYPCTDDGCPGCAEGDQPKQRYLANAVDVDDGKVIALKMPKSAAGKVLKRYDKYGTIMDRDYEMSRTGSGFDTEYDALPESPRKMNVNKYDTLDLWKLLEDMVVDEDEDEEEDEPRRRSKRSGKKSSRRARDEDDDEDEDLDDDDDEDEDEPRRRPARKNTASRRAASARKSRPTQKRAAKKSTAARRRKRSL